MNLCFHLQWLYNRKIADGLSPGRAVNKPVKPVNRGVALESTPSLYALLIRRMLADKSVIGQLPS